MKPKRPEDWNWEVDSDKYITKMDYNRNGKSTTGYYVRVQDPQKTIHPKFFGTGERSYGSWEAAYEAAKEYRNRMVKKLWKGEADEVMQYNLYDPPARDYARKPRRHSTKAAYGVIGVFYEMGRRNRSDAWVGNWIDNTVDKKDPSRQKKKQYSIDRYGFDEAFLLACLARARHVPQLIVTEPEALPMPKRRIDRFLNKYHQKSAKISRRKKRTVASGSSRYYK